jgi:Mrp family chromosome partitioning ATPase
VLAATDASILSARCDATLCVVRAGTTTEAELDRAMDTLHSVDANVIGTVFNAFDLSMAYGYKYRYRHYNRYGHYDQYHLPAHSE